MNCAISLGATLYVPVLHANAIQIARGSIPRLRSIIICLEDSLREDQAALGEKHLRTILAELSREEPTLHVYVRPRNVAMLARICCMPGINTIDGFVLPKVTTQSLSTWLSAPMHDKHLIMPTIEGEEAFDRSALSRLCGQMLGYSERIAAVRIGGNDILNLLGVRRSRFRTAYEGPLGDVIRNIAGAFIPNGFAVSSPVFEHFSSPDILSREVEEDIEHGLLTKTSIHPNQVEIIHSIYRPSAGELAEARAILDTEAPAVFGSSGSMCEPATHARWANSIIQRAQIFGATDGIQGLVSSNGLRC